MTDEEIRAIYRDTIDGLYAYVSRRCAGQQALAQDITQETWLRAIREWYRKGAPRNPAAWLTAVAHNLLVNEFRRKQPLSLQDVSPDDILGALDNGGMPDTDVVAAVNQALGKLPQAESRLIEAFHFEKCRVAQLAERNGMSERAVEGRLRRARERLRRELDAIIRANGGLR